MANQPTVDRSKVIDTHLNKPAELINQRFFNGVSVSTGWEPSSDGLFNYSLDIVLNVKEPVTEEITDEDGVTTDVVMQEGDPVIDFSYSPFVTIPTNVNRTCDRTNFPYVRTVAINTVRLYAHKIPNPVEMSLITITMKQVNTSEGSTNAGSLSDLGDVNMEKTSIQVRGESFLVKVDEENYTTERTVIEVFVSGFKGTEKQDIHFGRRVSNPEFNYKPGDTNAEKAEKDRLRAEAEFIALTEGDPIFFDMSGKTSHPVIIIENPEDISEEEEATTQIKQRKEDQSAVLVATIPAGLHLKDKMGYFIVPVIMNGDQKMTRITINTDKTPGTSSEKFRYEMKFPRLTRSTSGNTYYADGKKVTPENGIEILTNKIGINGVKSEASGLIVITGYKPSKDSPGETTSKVIYSETTSGVHYIKGDKPESNIRIFDDYNSLKIQFFETISDEETLVFETTTSIITDVKDIFIDPSLQYIMAGSRGENFSVPEFSVEVHSLNSFGFLEPYYGIIVIRDHKNKVIKSTPTGADLKGEFKLKVPAKKDYTDRNLPSYYRVEVYDIASGGPDFSGRPVDPENPQKDPDPVATTTISIMREGTSEDPHFLELSPSSILIPTDRNGVMENSKYTFKAIVRQGLDDVSRDWDYEVVSNTNPRDVKIVQGEGGKNNEFSVVLFEGDFPSAIATIRATKYESITGADGEVELIVQEQLIKEIALTRLRRQDSNFFIDGANIVKGYINDSAPEGMSFSPNPLVLSVRGPGDVQPVGVNWQYRNTLPSSGSGIGYKDWIDFYEEGTEEWLNQENSISIEPSSSLFDDSGVMTVRAKVDTKISSSSMIDKYSTNFSVRLLHLESTEYVTQIISNTSTQKERHVFLIDRYGNPIGGTEETDDAVNFQLRVFRGIEKLKYSEKDNQRSSEGYYSIDSIDMLNCKVRSTTLREDIDISFMSISGTSGQVKLVLNLEGRENRDVYFTWSTNIIESNKTRRVSVSSSNPSFSIQTASYVDIRDSNISSQYQQDFLDQNDPIRLYFETVDTNLKDISVIKRTIDLSDPTKSSLNSLSLRGFLSYEGGLKRPMVPINILSSSSGNRQSGSVIPRNYYTVSFLKRAEPIKLEQPETARVITKEEKELITNRVELEFSHTKGSIGKFYPSEFYNFNDNPTVVVQAPAGAEEISLFSITDEYVAEIFPLEITNEFEDYLRNNKPFNDTELVVDEENKKFLPISYNRIVNDFAHYGRDSWDSLDYLEISPSAAVEFSFFNESPADTSSTVKAESFTGELDLLQIHREVRPFAEIEETTSQIQNIIAGDYINNADMRVIEQSKDSIEEEYNRLRSLIEPREYPDKSFVIPIPEREPLKLETNYYHDLIKISKPSVENPDTIETLPGYQLKLDLDSYKEIPKDENNEAAAEGFNPNSIFGVNLEDDKYYFMEFSIKYREGEEGGGYNTPTFKFSRVPDSDSELSKDTIRQAAGMSTDVWHTYSFVIPPTNEKLVIDDKIKNYLIDNGLATEETELRALFANNERLANRSKNAPYYMYLNFEKPSKENVIMSQVSFSEIRFGYDKEITTYEQLADNRVYASFIVKTQSYLKRVEDLKEAFEVAGSPYKIGEFKNLFNLLREAERSIFDLQIEIDILDRIIEEDVRFDIETSSRLFAMGFQDSSGWLSSLRITPEGTIIQGEKNKIIGSTSIGSLYGKKVVIGKDPNAEDFAYDSLYQQDTGQAEGVLAVWDAQNNVWSSVLDKTGQHFLRYEMEDNQIGLVGYMVMNPSEIAAYQFNRIESGFDEAKPFDVRNNEIVKESQYPVFKIEHGGSVEINNLAVKETSHLVPATLDFMESVRVQGFESQDRIKKRRGIVFIGITGGAK